MANLFVVYGNLNHLHILNLKSNQIEDLSCSWNYYWKSYNNSNVLISSNRRPNEKGLRVADYYWYNLDNQNLSSILFTTSPQIKILEKNGLVIIENYIKSLSLLTGNYEWETDLSEQLGEYDKIKTVYGIVKETLWVVSQRGILFGIDIHNGKVLHRFNYDNLDTFQAQGMVENRYHRSLFDEKNQKLIGAYGHHYWEIDLLTAEQGLTLIDISLLNPNFYDSHWANVDAMIFDEQYIYFRNVELSTVGVINRKTHKIDWHYRIYDTEPRPSIIINNIQVTDNELYVLDTGGTLNIFEREKV